MRQGTTSSGGASAWFAEPTAIVESGATIGEGARIWHHAHVRTGATIGAATSLGKNVYVDTHVTIGARVKVQNNVSIYRGVTIADDVLLGPSCVFTNDRFPRAAAHDWEIVLTSVQRGASVGANATVVCGVTIGEWSIVGAGAVVTHDVAAHQLVVGSPARPAGWVCRCGRVVSRNIDAPVSFECDQCQVAPA
ncbi:MAG: N-acetyltransferase [Actinobacteria bacterium]|nr:N-acetyltransferase [Actinomycetota bacterium]